MESLSQMIKSIKLGKYVDIPIQFMWFIRKNYTSYKKRINVSYFLLLTLSVKAEVG